MKTIKILTLFLFVLTFLAFKKNVYRHKKRFATKKRKGASKVFSGSLYWIPEETYYVKNTNLLEKLKLKNVHYFQIQSLTIF